MTILLTGGGTGGHITPLLAVAHELKQLQPDIKLVYVGEKGGRFRHLTENHPYINSSRYIFAGKFRRYHGESWLRRLVDIKTNLLNLRDGLFVLLGFIQALWTLISNRPNAIFIKGGFVGVPVGLAAAIMRIPYVTHDSDTMPGLANRIISRWAKIHATGMPAEFYPYPNTKTRFTGIPISSDFKPISKEDQLKAKSMLNIPEKAQVILVTGGSLGSQRINTIMKAIVPGILEKNENLVVIHQVGQANQKVYGDYHNPRLRVEPFIEKFYIASAAADIVIARASATTIAGLSTQAKPTILIPSPFLSGGHQLKNAQVMKDKNAAVVLQEEPLLKGPNILAERLEDLLENSQHRQNLSRAIAELAKPDAARELAQLILENSK